MIIKYAIQFAVWCLISYVKFKLSKISGTNEATSKIEKVKEIHGDIEELVKDVKALFEANKKGGKK